MILLFFDLQGALFHTPIELRSQWIPFKARSIWAYVSPLPVLRPGSIQVENFFRTSGESNPRPWRWNKSIRNQHVKCNERRTRPCHRAYYIGGATPFHLCMIVRSPKLVSSEDQTGARASASYCSTKGVAHLHTALPVPVRIVDATYLPSWPSHHSNVHVILLLSLPIKVAQCLNLPLSFL